MARQTTRCLPKRMRKHNENYEKVERPDLALLVQLLKYSYSEMLRGEPFAAFLVSFISMMV